MLNVWFPCSTAIVTLHLSCEDKGFSLVFVSGVRHSVSVSLTKNVKRLIALQHCDIAVNWSGGLHHAKKFEVSVRLSVLDTR